MNNSTLTLQEFTDYFRGQIEPPSTDYHDNDFMKDIQCFVENYTGIDINSYDINEMLTDDICNGPITVEEVTTHLRKLKNNKAAGSDGIPAEFLKYACDDICMPLCAVYNSILEKGEWPTKWAEGIISPVHKKSSINNTDNYRKITVMPALGKVLESIINSRLVFRNIVLSIDDPFQSGFKERSRTVDNIFVLQSLIQRQRFKGKPLYTCFVDFTKAFDYINRYALYYKLIKRGIHGKLLNIICSMYDKATCRVKWKGVLGEQIDSKYGVLQGGMMSPKLFTEFLYDLQNYLESKNGMLLDNTMMTYVLYADDLVLCSDSATGLQNLIDGLHTFCSKWHLIVSLLKTNILIFGKRKNDNTFKFNGIDINITKEYKYLGTVISTSSCDIFSKNYNNLAVKARNAIFALNSYIENSVGYLNPCLTFKMFDAQISPVMEYASEIWYSGKETPELEKLHLGYLKSKLKIKSSSSTYAVYAECGRFPLLVKQKVTTLKFWQRIINMKDSHIVKKAYNSMIELHEMGQQNWCSHLKNILNEVESQQAWGEQTLDDRQLGRIKEKLYEKFMITCMDNINDLDRYPKLRTYALFKKEFRLETYLMSSNNISHTLALLKLRISSHNLRIETGRYTKPTKIPVNERLCIYCTSGEVEDEIHFITKCSLFKNERKELFNIVQNKSIANFLELQEIEQFTHLMINDEPNILQALGKFVYSCFRKRNNITTTNGT